MINGDSGATLHDEFNKHAADYSTNYSNPVTSGQLQDALRPSPVHEHKAPKSTAEEQHG